MLSERIQLWPDRDDVTLQAYILDEPADQSSGRDRPSVLVCPGGAYLFLSEREADPVALQFAARGYHAFVLRYSTYFRGKWPNGRNTAGRMPAGNPNTAFPGPLLDLGRAMQMIREQAARWHADPDRVALCGFSAGGHLAASLGVHWSDADLTGQLRASGQELRPAALILGYPLTDFLLMKKEAEQMAHIDQSLIDLWRQMNLAVFRNPDPSTEEFAQASPVRFISSRTPPTFIWHTVADDLVPVASSLRFASTLISQGVPCELHIFEQGPHGLSLADATTAASPDQINESAQNWLRLALLWLNRHLPV